MSGSSLLLDTNIVLYFLNGDDTLVPLLQENDLVISVITEIELLGYGSLKERELAQAKKFLNLCTVINLTTDIKEKAITIRRKYKLKLPDAVIMATAISLDVPLVTADKDFQRVQTANLILYEK